MIAMSTVLLFLMLLFDTGSGQEFETTHGKVKGKQIFVEGKSLDVFLGIPFAKPPVGDLRFKHPQSADPWKPEVKDVTMPMPSCFQGRAMFEVMNPGHPKRLTGSMSEDCLYLSIWKLSSTVPGSNKAVMLWIHGGGFSTGSKNLRLTSGQYLAAENDVVVVAINYRLGPLGFSFLGPDTIPGNMGLMDQVEALEWVRNNIENFGGDKNRITIFGESAGAYSVGLHLVSPLSKNLFNNAILQSGVPGNKLFKWLLSTTNEAKDNVKKLSEMLKCPASSDADIYYCLMSADPSDITASFEMLMRSGVAFNPIVGQPFLPKNPATLMEHDEHKKTNILTGVTKDEASLSFYSMLNVTNKVVFGTNETFSSKHFDATLTAMMPLRDTKRRMALKVFYESERAPPLDYVDILTHLGSDIVFKCPTLQFSSLYAKSSDVYLFSLDYRASNMPFPEWMGVPHTFDLDFVFGLPLNYSLDYNELDEELSRNMMIYWTNFAKTGNPNSPELQEWPVFNDENLAYLELNVGSKLAARGEFRRHQCAFVNDIIPMIPKDGDTDYTTTTVHEVICPSGSELLTGSIYTIFSLLSVSVWMLQM